MISGRLLCTCFGALAILGGACTISGSGGTAEPDSSSGGATASGGHVNSGGHSGSGGKIGSGGKEETGGITPTGGAIGSGGKIGSGGSNGSGGQIGSGGSGMGGSMGKDAGRDLPAGTGGTGKGGGGGPGAGGSTSAGGTTGTGTPAEINCDAAMPSGGTPHQSNNTNGTAAGLTWTIWTNSGPGTITTYSVPAFSASWNNSGDFLARIGLQWNNTKTYDQYGTISAQMAFKKSGSGGGYSYIGIYGWSTNPCIEFYIVDDSYNKMPVNPGNTTNKGTVTIDGSEYILYTRDTSGTGGSKCSGVSKWTQYYSVRKTARQCGVISITEHFDAWAKAGMTLGKMDQAQILVETGGGSGSIDFPTANVTTTQ
jgi:endo-1,4-beta-xylanase